MTENSGFWDTNDTGDGASAGYTESEAADFFRTLTQGSNRGGVGPDYLNELEVTGTATPVAVNTGGAIVYGIFYVNDASVNVAIPTPSTSTRVDYIVLRASWSAQTVRITRIAGTEGAGAPSLTQNAGTTWDIPLATASITTGGVITVTDAREWLSLIGDGDVSTVKIAADAVTGAKIADDAIDSEHYTDASIDTAHIADSQITTAKLAADAVDGTKIADNAINSEHYVDGSIDTVHIADSQVTAAKLATDSVATAKIVDGNVTTAKLAADAVDGTKIADDAINSEHYAAASIDTEHIADDQVTGAKIPDYAIDPRSHISGTNGIVVDPQNGDTRGVGAIDLQTSRTNATHVARTQYSTIGGGQDNAIPAGGKSYATIPGGQNAKADKYGQFVYAAGQFSSIGDAQTSLLVARNSTSDGTQTELFLDGNDDRMDIATDTTWMFRADIVARRTDADNESAAYTIEGCIDNNAGTTALVGSISKTVIAEDTAAWDVTAEADNTNDALVIKVTGQASKTIRWVARVMTVEVTG